MRATYYAELEELLAQSDFVVVCVPLTSDTRGLLGEKQFAVIKRDAILVNVARGAVLDHVALARALREGRLRMAALDVTDPEPLPRDHPLLDPELRGRIIFTPHVGSATTHTRKTMTSIAIKNLLAGIAGAPMYSCCNGVLPSISEH